MTKHNTGVRRREGQRGQQRNQIYETLKETSRDLGDRVRRPNIHAEEKWMGMCIGEKGHNLKR